MCRKCLARIKHSLRGSPLSLGPLPLLLFHHLSHCPSQLLQLLFPFARCPCFQASWPSVTGSVLPGMPLLPLSFLPSQILLPSLFSSNAISSRRALLLCQQTRTQIIWTPEGATLCPQWPLPYAWVRIKPAEPFSPPPRSTQKCPLGGDKKTTSQRGRARREATQAPPARIIYSFPQQMFSEHVA